MVYGLTGVVAVRLVGIFLRIQGVAVCCCRWVEWGVSVRGGTLAIGRIMC